MTNDLDEQLVKLIDRNISERRRTWERFDYDATRLNNDIREMLTGICAMLDARIPAFVIRAQAMYGARQITAWYTQGVSDDTMAWLVARYVTATAQQVMEFLAHCALMATRPEDSDKLITYHNDLQDRLLRPVEWVMTPHPDVTVPPMVHKVEVTPPAPLSKREQKALSNIRKRFSGRDMSQDGIHE